MTRQVVERVPMDRLELCAVLEYGIEVGELTTATDALRFVESPRKYRDLIVAYEHDRDVQGELQDEARAIL